MHIQIETEKRNQKKAKESRQAKGPTPYTHTYPRFEAQHVNMRIARRKRATPGSMRSQEVRWRDR
jgi:hypothetical protein